MESTVNAYVKFYVMEPENGLHLVSNQADCTEIAIQVARGFPQVRQVEAQSSGDSDYIAPTDEPFGENQQPNHMVYKFDLVMQPDVNLYQFASELEAQTQQTLAAHGIRCEVSTE
jgi:hypothetical protein